MSQPPVPSSSRNMILIVVLVLVLFTGAVLGLAYYRGWLGGEVKKPQDLLVENGQLTNKGPLTFICTGKFSMPEDGFEQPAKDYNKTFFAGIDIESRSGWYDGIFSITESRKGALILEGSQVSVQRPLMFERYGSMLINEHFTLERSSGAFEMTLTLRGGRKVPIIKANCAKFTRAPF